MKRFLGKVAVCMLALAGTSAHAMPIGVRTMMQGRAAVRQVASTPVVTPGRYKVTFGKNGGTGGDNYVTATYGSAMPTPRTAPKKAGYVFDGYWDTTKEGGKQYYDGSMKSVRNWDKAAEVTLWAKWTPVRYKVTFGKNGGTGGDNYVTATYGSAMPTPRTAPTRSGWTFAGYWDTLAQDANGNPTGKQYYDASMKSVRNFDKTAAMTLWAKWTVRVKLGKNGGTGGDDYVTVTYNQPFPKRTMPKKSGYTFGGYWVSSSSRTGQCYNTDGTGTSTMKWTTGGSPTVWALWTVGNSGKKTAACVDTGVSEVLEGGCPQPPDVEDIWSAGLYTGVVSGGEGRFMLQLDEADSDGLRTAFLVVETEDGTVSTECEAVEFGDAIRLVSEGGTECILVKGDDGTLELSM